MAQNCCTTTNVRHIKLEENGRVAIIKNDERWNYIKIVVDDCLVKNGIRADWLIWRPATGQLIVELKGRNVDHAIAQVTETADFLTRNEMRDGKLAGLIVCRQYPSGNTQVQKAMLRFKKKYGGRITVVTQNKAHDFSAVL